MTESVERIFSSKLRMEMSKHIFMFLFCFKKRTFFYWLVEFFGDYLTGLAVNGSLKIQIYHLITFCVLKGS